MMFFFKNKEVVVDCFTTDLLTFELFKPDYSKKFIPKWWKETELHYPHPTDDMEIIPTIRSCPGFIDYFKYGFMLPIWTDIDIEASPANVDPMILKVRPISLITEVVDHPAKQRGEYLPVGKYSHFKIVSPWSFRASDSTPFLFTRSIWNFDSPDDYLIPNAVVEFKYQSATNINAFIAHRKEKFRCQIKAGEPLVHFIPLTEKRVVLKHHLVTKEELDHLVPQGIRFSSLNGYAKYKKIKSSLEQKNK